MNNTWDRNSQDTQRRQNNNPSANIWRDGEFNAGPSVQNQQVNNTSEPGSQGVYKVVEEKQKEEESRQTSFDENYFKS